MKSAPAPSTARILVATDNVDDARQIARQLQGEFKHVRTSVQADLAVADFEDFRPEVLVLAFDTIEKSERYYLGLYRLSAAAIQESHRTVILCGKDEVKAAFDLCKRDYFDDYVLYWPQSYDGSRLAMSIWIVCRQMVALQTDLPGRAELLQHAKHLAEIEKVVRDPAETTLDALRGRLEPALAGTRPLADTVRQLKPRILVVDDDELSRQLVQQALDVDQWQISLAHDGSSALGQLRRMRPDVILMDVRLPGLDGVALTRRLKASPHLASIPIIMMTGNASRETLLTSMDAGAAAFVVKPVSREALELKLLQVLPR